MANTKHTPWIGDILHDHPQDTIFHPNCPRCKLNHAAPEMLAALETIAKIPCLTNLLGEDAKDNGGCGCASCIANAATAKAKQGLES